MTCQGAFYRRESRLGSDLHRKCGVLVYDYWPVDCEFMVIRMSHLASYTAFPVKRYGGVAREYIGKIVYFPMNGSVAPMREWAALDNGFIGNSVSGSRGKSKVGSTGNPV